MRSLVLGPRGRRRDRRPARAPRAGGSTPADRSREHDEDAQPPPASRRATAAIAIAAEVDDRTDQEPERLGLAAERVPHPRLLPRAPDLRGCRPSCRRRSTSRRRSASRSRGSRRRGGAPASSARGRRGSSCSSRIVSPTKTWAPCRPVRQKKTDAKAPSCGREADPRVLGICVSRNVRPIRNVSTSPAFSPARLPRLIDCSAQCIVKLDVTQDRRVHAGDEDRQVERRRRPRAARRLTTRTKK